ncbi:MAG: McrC family protein [Firmicutes bacterium]|nr:McrC family protein [Bacillota bacterium]
MNKDKLYRITEYESFVCGKQVPGYKPLPKKTFDELKNFILTNKEPNAEFLELLGISYRKGVGEIITAKNYVGVISMKDGTTIEILPKIYGDAAVSKDGIYANAKKLLLRMLQTLKNTPFKSLQTSNVDVTKMDVFEVFIRMYIEEVFSIVKRGLKSSYESVSENTTYFKGKLKVSENIKYNIAHKERVFVEYDDFNQNRPENRLLKTTLEYLYKRTTLLKNKKDIKNLLASFSSVSTSTNYEKDFSKVIKDRSTKDYEMALTWCQVFLRGKSFTSFIGSEVAVALLFPMEILFESYIAVKLRRVLDLKKYKVTIQAKGKYLFNELNGRKWNRFQLRPDIVVERIEDKKVFIMDTKWKVLSSELSSQNYGISQSDMYQMYAYHKKYDAENVTLIYPKTDKMDEEVLTYKGADQVTVRATFVDLMDVEGSLERIMEENLS